ncbi:dihydrolipoyl dehydrogenase [Roseospirillum parvum]|uniref:Dihydrolipoyl dehydrogenase n=1 Tax=Roseospirillum parvum TaxID=83401 RepID=A0A1G7YFW5_9PROT|nr:dihydrolipoyl dehydrogenase [Roseospirillum parvum]SDG95418.1 dihydrolipoamide dehydrogenase [Roseospirillum parvum]
MAEQRKAEPAFQVAVVGSGPGGYVAAIRAAQLGLRTAIVEAAELGGICLNWGCIPTKALLRSADIYRTLKQADSFGLKTGEVGADLKAIVARSRQVAGQLSGGVGHLLKKNGVTVIRGRAQLDGPGRLAVRGEKGTESLAAEHIILATGARARTFPGLEADGEHIWTYRHALKAETLPKSLLVVGSGAIGIEFASFFHTLGSQTTVVEVLDRILPQEDAEISALMAKSLKRDGMTLHTGTTVEKLEVRDGGVVATLARDGKQHQVTAERVLLAVGISPNSANLGLEGSKVKLDRGHVVTGPFGVTGEPGVYAIGDLTAPPWLAHKASHEGVLAAEHIAGVKGLEPLDPLRIPGCTYAHPQVASVGLSEDKAKAQGHAVKVGRFPFIGNGKAVALGEAEGLIKTIFDADTGELLGAHMIGAEVTELIQGYAIAMGLETTEAELIHTVFPHPTLSEMMHESVLDAEGRALHF